MNSIFFVCGLPRSGTTAVFDFVRNLLPNFNATPDELPILLSNEALSGISKILDELYEGYLVEEKVGGYSPYGTKVQFNNNAFMLFLNCIQAINYRDFMESGSISDSYKDQIQAYRNKSVYELINEGCIFKSPLSETNINLITKIFQTRKLIFIYCIREIEKVFDSVVEKLRWYEGNEFAAACNRSYDSILDNIDSSTHSIIPVKVDRLHEQEYRDSFIHSIMQHANGFADKDLNHLGSIQFKSRHNRADHLANKFSKNWKISFIKSLPFGEECIDKYRSILDYHEDFYHK